MKKHITVKALVADGYNKVVFTITAQTHSGKDFGSCYNLDTRLFRATNGIVLGSNRHPARDTDSKNTIWLRGSQTRSNNRSIACTSDEWKKIAEAIRQYNEYEFPVRPAPAPVRRAPAANPCQIQVG